MKQWCVPLCFTSRRQFDLWNEAARGSDFTGSSYCADCTAAYQQRMIAQQQCAHPGTRFYLDADGFIEGRRPTVERLRPEAAA